MSRFRSILVKEITGPGTITEDGNPTPKQFRTPHEVAGVQRTTPAEAVQPIGSPVSKTPQPQ
jgi:hypothetical protein